MPTAKTTADTPDLSTDPGAITDTPSGVSVVVEPAIPLGLGPAAPLVDAQMTVGDTRGAADLPSDLAMPQRDEAGGWYVEDKNDLRRWPVTPGMAGNVIQGFSGLLITVGAFPPDAA